MIQLIVLFLVEVNVQSVLCFLYHFFIEHLYSVNLLLKRFLPQWILACGYEVAVFCLGRGAP